ncbi:MAG: 2-C-methyl-D-erythritol 2,4-cyclodiphosphate synthase [Candidatus Auribacterota bacterium]|jgi:2-C-methyl-D-erythritol 2,4-cyclodiphosphate synthase|nr:2-C-methyl-D-erythritol 2,4-cyclodiphosphate synthase [Candidatus Auribacterota bacterium]
MRVGMGCDIHPFDPSSKLFLGGVFFPSCSGLKGHSDADVVLHAVCDAILGAAGLGDIGEHFPDTDAAYKGKESIFFLEKVIQLVRQKGFYVGNIDITILAEIPKISPRKQEMRNIIASVCEIDPDRVNIKATTTEKLGAIGRSEGIATYAVATLESLRSDNG